MKKLAVFILMAAICFTPYCADAAARPDSKKGIYFVHSLTGGATGSLDSLDITGASTPNQYDLIDGDGAIVMTISGTTVLSKFYTFDADGTSAESSPLVIRPDDYGAGPGVWRLDKLQSNVDSDGDGEISDETWYTALVTIESINTGAKLETVANLGNYASDVLAVADQAAFTALVANATTTTSGAVELATNAETVTGTDTGRAVTPKGLTDAFASPPEIGGTSPGVVNATSVVVSPTASPGWEFSDSDNAAGTAYIYGNSSGGANDIIMTLGVEDSGGENQGYIELDGVNETFDILQNATMSGTLNVTGQITGDVTGALTGNADTATTASAAPVGGITGMGANVGTMLATPSSANLRAALTDESGSGVAIFAGGNIGAATATTPGEEDNDTSVATTAYVQTELADQAPALGADDNYVTDAEKVVIGNTSGTNTGDNTVATAAASQVITDNAIVTVDDAAAANGQVAVFTANGIEGHASVTDTELALLNGETDLANQAELNAVAALVDTDDEIIAIINASPSTYIDVAAGGTGVGTLTDGGVLLGSGTGAVTTMAVLTDGQMIVGDGTTDPVAESGATLRTSIGVGTGDSPQFTAIEVGAASDTTLARSAAGVVTIEGKTIPTESHIPFSVYKPNDLDDNQRDFMPFWTNNTGGSVTITKIYAMADVDDTDFRIEEYDADGSSNEALVKAETCDTGSGPYTNDGQTTITNATVENGHILVLDCDDTDVPDYLHFTISYTQ